MNTFDLTLEAQRNLLCEKLAAQRALLAQRLQPTFDTPDGLPRSAFFRHWLGAQSRPLGAAVAALQLVTALASALAAAQVLRSALRPASPAIR